VLSGSPEANFATTEGGTFCTVKMVKQKKREKNRFLEIFLRD
jgi:hypothetical protein